MNLPETILKTIKRHGLIPEGVELVVAVSGGADSVALAHALHRLGFKFTVAHINHQLRGAESDADEAFVRSLGFPTRVHSVNVKQRAAATGQSIEMAARQARHHFFAEFENAVIALGHHADDQVETFFLKLARGAGTDGLGGMEFAQPIGAIRLIRPMLETARTEILTWLQQNGFSWREDASNTDETYLRNRVRHNVLPMLEQELNPTIRQTVLRTMDILREENRFMDATPTPKPSSSLPLALQRRAIRNWLFEHGAAEAGFEAVEQIRALMAAGRGTTVYELNDRQRVVFEYGEPRFEQKQRPPKALPGLQLTTEAGSGWKKDCTAEPGALPAEASFDAECVGDSPIEVRLWNPGDRMEPLGMKGRRKLQDIFTDLKIPQQKRSRIPVVVCRGEIIWIPGYRIARGWAVPSPTGKAVHVRIEQIQTQ